MGKTKERRAHEEYEEYWNFTAAWTDIYGIKFNKALRITIHFIDKNIKALEENASFESFKESPLYDELQKKIVYAFGWTGSDPRANARKGINTFVKLGFVNPFLNGYHPLAKKFVNAKNDNERCILFSKIFYDSASFASGVTNDRRNVNHLAFLLRTLSYNKSLNKEDIKALMITDINQYPKGYLNKEELESQLRESILIDFEERKYNQISHLMSFLKSFSDIHYSNSEGRIYFADNPDIAEEEINEKFHCDPIKLRLHRQELLEESREIYGAEVCYLEKKPYKGLRDSHIKPKQLCVDEGNEEQAYDVNNGILLSPNTDQYFDKFDISFADNGEILIGNGVAPEIQIELQTMKLGEEVLTKQRKRYLAYHRARFFEKNGEK